MGRTRTETRNEFGQRIRRLTGAKGMTLVGFAQAIDEPVRTVQNWVYKKGWPRIDAEILGKMASVLGVSVDELLPSRPVGEGGSSMIMERRFSEFGEPPSPTINIDVRRRALEATRRARSGIELAREYLRHHKPTVIDMEHMLNAAEAEIVVAERILGRKVDNGPSRD